MGVITKWSFLLFSSVFFVATLNAQYPATGNKQRLGWQTTGDGLVWRGAISDTSTLDPSGLNNAWMLLDTVSGNLYAYRTKAWRLVSGGGGGGASMPFDSVTFNINEGDASEQELKYSAEKGYLQYGGLDSVQIPLLPGIWYVRNDTSVTIPKGTVVRASGTLGASGRIKVKHMIANGSIPAMYVLGIAMQDIATGADGYVMTQGKIRQVNTQAYSEGAVLYADVDTLGGLTQTKPGNGYLKLPIAFVVHSASNGTLAVRIDPGSSLHDLHDVDTTGRVNGSVLRYDSALKYWKASTTAGIVAGDTSAMLTNYINVVDTAAMLTNYINVVDTAAMLTNYVNIADTAAMLTNYINVVDTAAMLTNYINVVDTAAMLTNYVNIADTAAMLTNYINIADTATMLSSYISNADTSVFARDFQISGTSGQVAYFNAANRITGDTSLYWNNISRRLGVGLSNSLGALHIKSRNNVPNLIIDSNNNETSGSIRFTGGDNAFFSSEESFLITIDANNNQTNRVFAVLSNTYGSTGGNGLFAINEVGNVFIQSTTPVDLGSKLHILGSGSTSSTSSLRINNSSNANLFFVRDDGRVGIGTTSPARTLHVEGEARISDLTTDTPTRIVGADADGDLGAITLGTGLSIASGTLNATGVDTTSLSNRINTKLNISDTTAMLSTYLKKADTASLSNRINLKLNIADTTAMLSTYLKKADTLSLSNRINTKLNISDTTAMLSTYLKKADTASLSNRINLKLNIADTSAMLSTYLKKADTLSLSNRINLKLNASDTTKYVKYADTSTTIATKANVALKLNISDTSVFARDWQIAGTTNYLPRFTGSGGSIGNSNSYQTGDTLLTLMSPFYGLRLNSNATPNSFTGWMPYSKMVLNVNGTSFAGIAMGDPSNSPVANQVAIQMTSWTGGGANFYSTRLTNDNAGNFRIATSPVSQDADTVLTTRFSIMNDGKVGIGTTSPARTLHVEGEARISDLTTDTPTQIVGADADGDLGAVTLGTGLSIASGTLNGPSVSGTTNYLPKFTGASSVGNSVLYNQYNNRVSHGNAGYSQFLSVKNAYHLFGYGSTADDQPIHFIEGHVGTTATYAPQLRLLRGRTTTGDAGGRVQFGDYLGYMSFWPNENVLFNQPSAYIAAVIDSITGNADFPTSIRFAVAPNGSEGAVERVTINNAGRVGIGTTSPARTLHVEGEARISDLTTDTPTRIVGADADGDLGAVTLGTGLSISSGTLNASGITSVYIPINLFSPGDTVTNTTNAKNFFLVHSGLNGYCIDSYTVKAIAGTGSADIQLDKNNTGGNLQAISGTTVYTKDTNIALVTGDYIRGQVFNLSGTLIGLGLTLEIKATCN